MSHIYRTFFGVPFLPHLTINDQAVEERREHDRLAEDSFLSLSLSELKDKITGIHDLPTNTIIDGKNQILFAAIKYFDKPEVKFCLVVNENLNYELWSADRKIKKFSIHLGDELPWLPNSLTSVKLVVKIL